MELHITERQAELLRRRNPGMTIEQAVNRELAQAMCDGTADAVARSRRKGAITKALLILAAVIGMIIYRTFLRSPA